MGGGGGGATPSAGRRGGGGGGGGIVFLHETGRSCDAPAVLYRPASFAEMPSSPPASWRARMRPQSRTAARTECAPSASSLNALSDARELVCPRSERSRQLLRFEQEVPSLSLTRASRRVSPKLDRLWRGPGLTQVGDE